MADFKTVKTFTLLAKIGSGLSLSALFPAKKSSKAASFLSEGISRYTVNAAYANEYFHHLRSPLSRLIRLPRAVLANEFRFSSMYA